MKPYGGISAFASHRMDCSMGLRKAYRMKIAILLPSEVLHRSSEVVEVYRQAFREPPYAKGENVVRQFQSTLQRHAERDGFRCVAAMHARGGELAGFAYGYISRQGQWWHDQVVRKLSATEIKTWFTDAFEIVEFAVRPRLQGQGIGGRLHDALLQGLSQRTAVLSTLDAVTRGYCLYVSKGWEVLRRDFYFSGVSDPYLIMGRRLPLGR
jgi:GNAT superfamily N-acetyltransferase